MSRKLLIMLLSLVLIFVAVAISGTAHAATDDATRVENLILGVGSNETERNLNWYSEAPFASSVIVSPEADLQNGEFPEDALRFNVSMFSSQMRDGYYYNRATMTGLHPDTRYAYAILWDDGMSDIYCFDTAPVGSFNFAFVGDPQVHSQGNGIAWQDTVDKIKNEFGAELIISAGDQISTPDSFEYWEYFAVEELSAVAFAPNAGPGHDVTSSDTHGAYTEHYNLPNLSDEYGVKGGTSNYWYVYNNVLFISLNMCDSSAATNGDHKAFIMDAIDKNPDMKWKIVVMHNSLFSTGMHGDPEYQYYASEIGKFRPALAPMFTDLGIDVVLSGHDHVYLRTYMMDGVSVSESDVITDNRVEDPYGTLYVCASSSTGSKFYDKTYEPDFAACENYEERKSAIKFSVTDDSISMTSYFLDDMSVFDTFTISKDHSVCSLTKHDATEAGCENDGSREYYSCRCGKKYTDPQGENLIIGFFDWVSIPATDHDWVEATCTTKKTCNNCGKTEGKSLGHSWTDVSCTAPQTCRECGVSRGAMLPHNPTEATCTEPSLCKACGTTLSEALPHTPTEATCTAPSLCEECAETLSDPLGHDMTDPTCTAGSECTRCGATENNALGHEFESDADAECNRCSYKRTVAPKDDSIRDHDGDENTDDDNVIIIVIAASASLLLCGAAALAILLKKKSKTK